MHKAADEAIRESTFAEPCCEEQSPLLSLSEALKYVYSIVTKVDRETEDIDYEPHLQRNECDRQTRSSTRSLRHGVSSSRSALSQQLEADKLEHIFKVFAGRRSLSPNWKLRHSEPETIPVISPPLPRENVASLFTDEPDTARGRALRAFMENDAESIQEVILPMLPPALNVPTLTPLREKDAFQKSTPPLPVRGVDARFQSLLERTATRKLGERLQKANYAANGQPIAENQVRVEPPAHNKINRDMQARIHRALQDYQLFQAANERPSRPFSRMSPPLDPNYLACEEEKENQDPRGVNAVRSAREKLAMLSRPPLSESEWAPQEPDDDCYVSVSTHRSYSQSLPDSVEDLALSEPHFGLSETQDTPPEVCVPAPEVTGSASPSTLAPDGNIISNKRRRSSSLEKATLRVRHKSSALVQEQSSSKRRSLVAGVIDVCIPQSDGETSLIAPHFSQPPSAMPMDPSGIPVEAPISELPSHSMILETSSTDPPTEALVEPSLVLSLAEKDALQDHVPSPQVSQPIDTASAIVEVQDPLPTLEEQPSGRVSTDRPRGRKKRSKSTKSRKRSCSSASAQEETGKKVRSLNSPSWVTPRPAPIITVNLDDNSDDVPRPSPSDIITLDSDVAAGSEAMLSIGQSNRSRAAIARRRSGRRRGSDTSEKSVAGLEAPEAAPVDALALVEEISSRRLASAGVQANVPKATRSRNASHPVEPPFGEAPLRRVSIGERPKRLRVPPLQWWRNERIEYEQDSGGHGFRAKAVYLVDASRAREEKKRNEKKQLTTDTSVQASKNQQKRRRQHGSQQTSEGPPNVIQLDKYFDCNSTWLSDVSKIPMKPILTEEVGNDSEEVIVRAHRWRNIDWVDVHSSEHTGYKVKLLSKSPRIQTCAVQLSPKQEKGIDSTGECRFFLTILQGENKRILVTLFGDSKDQECALSPGDWLVIPPRTKYDIANHSKSKVTSILMNIIMNTPSK